MKANTRSRGKAPLISYSWQVIVASGQFHAGVETRVHTEQEAGLIAELVWTFRSISRP